MSARNPQLVNYINQNLALGISEEVIKRSLVSTGWKKEDIEVYFPKPKTNFKEKFVINIPLLSLRIGIAFVFIYAAVNFTLNPQEGEKFIPNFLTILLTKQTFLKIFTVYELFLAFWILWGKWPRISASLAALTTFAVTIPNIAYFDVLFRNVAILAAAIALVALPSQKKVS